MHRASSAIPSAAASRHLARASLSVCRRDSDQLTRIFRAGHPRGEYLYPLARGDAANSPEVHEALRGNARSLLRSTEFGVSFDALRMKDK